jgi:hypothetical protein
VTDVRCNILAGNVSAASNLSAVSNMSAVSASFTDWQKGQINSKSPQEIAVQKF